jgi:hypothetical protein
LRSWLFFFQSLLQADELLCSLFYLTQPQRFVITLRAIYQSTAAWQIVNCVYTVLKPSMITCMTVALENLTSYTCLLASFVAVYSTYIQSWYSYTVTNPQLLSSRRRCDFCGEIKLVSISKIPVIKIR